MAETRAVASALVFRAPLPPHPALSLGERENRPPRFRHSRAPRDSSQRGVRCSLSLRERARVRGNETQPSQDGRTNVASSTRPDPRLRVGYHFERRACRWRKRAVASALVFRPPLPPLPALSLGERENASPPSNAASRFCRPSRGFISRLSRRPRVQFSGIFIP